MRGEGIVPGIRHSRNSDFFRRWFRSVEFRIQRHSRHPSMATRVLNSTVATGSAAHVRQAQWLESSSSSVPVVVVYS